MHSYLSFCFYTVILTFYSAFENEFKSYLMLFAKILYDAKINVTNKLI